MYFSLVAPVSGLIALFAVALPATARAQSFPSSKPLFYSGLLTDKTGKALTSPQVLGIALWKNKTSTAILDKVCSVAPASTSLVQGRFRLELPTDCVTKIRDNADLWVEATVGTKTMPRTKIGAVPYVASIPEEMTKTGDTNFTIYSKTTKPTSGKKMLVVKSDQLSKKEVFSVENNGRVEINTAGIISPSMGTMVIRGQGPMMRIHNTSSGGAATGLDIGGDFGSTITRGGSLWFYDYPKAYLGAQPFGLHLSVGGLAGGIHLGGGTGTYGTGNFNSWMSLSKAGVGIGTVDPKEALQIGDRMALGKMDSANNVVVSNNAYFEKQWKRLITGPASWIVLSEDGDIGLITSPTTAAAGTTISDYAYRLLVRPTGNVGIGTMKPLSKLTVKGLPSAPPAGDTSGTAGLVCITNDGNMWIDKTPATPCN